MGLPPATAQQCLLVGPADVGHISRAGGLSCARLTASSSCAALKHAARRVTGTSDAAAHAQARPRQPPLDIVPPACDPLEVQYLLQAVA